MRKEELEHRTAPGCKPGAVLQDVGHLLVGALVRSAVAIPTATPKQLKQLSPRLDVHLVATLAHMPSPHTCFQTKHLRPNLYNNRLETA